jgi:cytochrome c oxidase subunit 1
VRVIEGMAPPPVAQPAGAALQAHGGAHAWAAPGTFALAIVFLTSFVLYYFVNWKYLSTVWPLK